jgi:hypothetical protein
MVLRSADRVPGARSEPVVRIRNAMAVYAFGVLGIFLLAVPWTAVWTHVTLALVPTPFGPWVRSGWLRGAVSGLGLLDLLVAVECGLPLWRELRAGRGNGS